MSHEGRYNKKCTYMYLNMKTAMKDQDYNLIGWFKGFCFYFLTNEKE